MEKWFSGCLSGKGSLKSRKPARPFAANNECLIKCRMIYFQAAFAKPKGSLKTTQKKESS
nr:hypothetical protein [uncultured Kingella sp.]